MNQRYIDFVPSNRLKEEAPAKKPVLKINFVDLDQVEDETIIEETVIIEETIPVSEETEPMSENIEMLETIDESDEKDPSEEKYQVEDALDLDTVIDDLEENTEKNEEKTEEIILDEEPADEERNKAPEIVPVENESDGDPILEEPEYDLDTPIEELMGSRDEELDASADLGVIEDYVPIGGDKSKSAFVSPAFTTHNVEKRPLSKSIEEIKSEKILKKKPEEKKEEKKEAPKTEKKYPFINTHLIEKRPLSKTDYRGRTPVVKEEENKGPITIIDNQDNNGRFGTLILIALTIFVGAAIGTIAFLLIPR